MAVIITTKIINQSRLKQHKKELNQLAVGFIRKYVYKSGYIWYIKTALKNLQNPVELNRPVCIWDCTSGLCCWTLWHDPLCPVLSCRYPGPVCRVGGWDELLWHEDQPQQRHLPPLPATQQSTGHWVRQVWAENTEIHAYTHQISQSHSHKHSLSSYWVIVYIPKQKQTHPICSRLKYYASAATAKMPLTAARREWKQSNCVWNKESERLGFRRNWSSGPHFCTSSRVLPPTLSGRNGRSWDV